MEQLFNIQQILLETFHNQPFYERACYEDISFGNPITGIVGARGIGKTTLLLRTISKAKALGQNALYVSADNVYFLESSLLSLADDLYTTTNIRLLCIDEIHKAPNWQQQLKNIADIYKQLRIVFTGSSMIDIVHGKYDLSRRVILYKLPGFSFREHLEFTTGAHLPTITLNDLPSKHIEFCESLELPNILHRFKNYCRTGYYPFTRELSTEHDMFQAMEHAAQKTIYEDIATLHSLKTPTLLILEKLYQYILSSVPGELNAYKLSKTLSKDFSNISEYLKLLEQASLIRSLHSNHSGKAMLRNPEKMYPENTNLIYASYMPTSQDNLLGTVRETFALKHLQNAKYKVYYPKQGDFSVNDLIFEVGGKNKTKKQIKNIDKGFILSDDLTIGGPTMIPLYSIGFLY